jgi:uncharacterized protein YbgA (DUF1722 family)/uncharacterized protein YbbK (DUF523 family)
MVKSGEAFGHGSWRHWHAEDEPIRLGVSSCLMGETVRFDGGHARDRFTTDVLGRWVEFVPVCPEVEAGMGTPRPTIRLVEDESDGPVRLVAPSTGEDFTRPMKDLAAARIAALQELDLDGYVLKRNSPSCGLERIKVYLNGMPSRRNAAGLFAAELIERWPALPLEEDGRLNDARLRENFIERIFARNRWRTLVRGGLSRKRLVEFHTAHKLLLRAHNEAAYQRLGRLVGSAGTVPDAELFRAYELEFQGALRTKANRKRHTNVMQHAMGYFKGHLSGREKAALLASIEDYRLGLLPLVVPLSLLRYEIQRHEVSYLAGQLYFDPNPKELMLRNHV